MPNADLCVMVLFHMLVHQCPKCLIPRLNLMTHKEIVYGEMFELMAEENTMSRTHSVVPQIA
jgi:hypothetical protein